MNTLYSKQTHTNDEMPIYVDCQTTHLHGVNTIIFQQKTFNPRFEHPANSYFRELFRSRRRINYRHIIPALCTQTILCLLTNVVSFTLLFYFVETRELFRYYFFFSPPSGLSCKSIRRVRVLI